MSHFATGLKCAGHDDFLYGLHHIDFLSSLSMPNVPPTGNSSVHPLKLVKRKTLSVPNPL